MSLEQWIAIIGVSLALLASIDSGIQRYNKATTSKYAAQRDFEHLRRNQEQLKTAVADIQDELEKMQEDNVRLKTQLEMFLSMLRAEIKGIKE